jgi:hypothetical protein
MHIRLQIYSRLLLENCNQTSFIDMQQNLTKPAPVLLQI